MGLCAPLVSKRGWASVTRLRVLGKRTEGHCQNDHRGLNRSPWSARDASGTTGALTVRGPPCGGATRASSWQPPT
jgi:hypothetical protein